MHHHVRISIDGECAIYEEIERQHGRLTMLQMHYREGLRRKAKRGIQWVTDCPTPGAEGRCPGHEKGTPHA